LDVGKRQGYCVGLGATDPAGGQYCHHWYAFDLLDPHGFISGSNVYSGEDLTMVVVTGGTDGWLGVTGGLNIPFFDGIFTHNATC
jgi:hypothetical protein